MTLNCYKFKFSRNFALLRIFGGQYTAQGCHALARLLVVLSLAAYAFYRAMHYSAKRDLALNVVRPSVCLSVCNVCGLGSHSLEILETNCTDN